MENAFSECEYCRSMQGWRLPDHRTEMYLMTRDMECTPDSTWVDYATDALSREPHDWASVWGMQTWLHTMHANYHRRSRTMCPWYARLIVNEALAWMGAPKAVRVPTLGTLCGD